MPVPSFRPCACSFSQFCTAAMVHSAPVVREVAVRIILLVYRQHGAAVVSYLPPRDAAVRKNFLYKTLFNEFAKIDGKLVETQARIPLPVLHLSESHIYRGMASELADFPSVKPPRIYIVKPLHWQQRHEPVQWDTLIWDNIARQHGRGRNSENCKHVCAPTAG